MAGDLLRQQGGPKAAWPAEIAALEESCNKLGPLFCPHGDGVKKTSTWTSNPFANDLAVNQGPTDP